MTLKDKCTYCENKIPFSPGNPNYHVQDGGYLQCYSALSLARLDLAYMDRQDQITIEDLDRIVLTERSSLETMTIEQIEERCIELQHAFETLQKNMKLLKTKQITALELRETKMGKMTKAEVKEVKKVKKVDDALAMMEAMLKDKKASSVSSVIEQVKEEITNDRIDNQELSKTSRFHFGVKGD